MKKTALISAAVLVIAACNPSEKTKTTRETVTVRVVSCADTQNDNSICYVGSVGSTRQTSLSAPSPSTVNRINVKKGQKVKQGEILAELYSSSVESAYEISKATLSRAEDGLERAKQVYETGSVPQAKMVEIQSQVDQARAGYNAASQSMEDLKLKAPYSGTVADIFYTEGEHAAIGAPIIRIIDTESLEILFSVPENEYRNIAVGQTARMDIPALGAASEVKVSAKGVQADAVSHSYECSANPVRPVKGLLPGMVCKLYFTSGSEDYIVIPSGAVMSDTKGRYVWVVEKSIAQRRYIKTGGYSGKGIIVTEGLRKTDTVIVGGSGKVSTGMKVKSVR